MSTSSPPRPAPLELRGRGTFDSGHEEQTVTLLLLEDGACPDWEVASFLRARGFAVTRKTAELALEMAEVEQFDALVVVALGGSSIRQKLPTQLVQLCPCLVLQPSSIAPEERLWWLEWGADAVIGWPGSSREVGIQLRNLVARQRRSRTRGTTMLKVGSLSLWPESHLAFLGERQLPLTDYEFRILLVLAHHPGCPLSREQILERAKGSAEEAFDRSIDVRMSRLRSKIEQDPRRPRMLMTIRGVGYALVAS